jgi:hypothetical protein
MKKLAEKKRQLLMKKYASDQLANQTETDPTLKPE